MRPVLLVVAKAPVPGTAKTRLCPPATPEAAAGIAAAALLDTLDAVRATPGATPAVALTGQVHRAARAAELREALAGLSTVLQRGRTFAERLVNAHADTAVRFPGRPVLQIGMDTPQVTPELLARCLARLGRAPAALGPATDGGWWVLGLRDPGDAVALARVPMSTPDTGASTRVALAARGLFVADLPELSDVDTIADVVRVAALAPGGRFAAAARDLLAGATGDSEPALAGATGDSEPALAGATGDFEPALAGAACRRLDGDGHLVELPVGRWHGPPQRADRPVLRRCAGPTLDLGCGPGRLAGALAARGVLALGVDASPVAVRLTRRRGANALCRNVFDPLPDEGRWAHVLLVDGNVGIGGDPGGLLRRCRDLLRPGGTAIVETEPPGARSWRGRSVLEHAGGRTGRFLWARVGLDAVPSLARAAGLAVRAVLAGDGRWFAELGPR